MAYHSKKIEKIYHTCRNCHIGNNIEKENLRKGKPYNPRLCRECEEIQKKGNCEPGIPIPAR